MLIRMRLWLILALAKLWCKNDEARWFGIRHNLPEVLLAYLNDISPEVRAATVYALGNLIENQTTDPSKQNHADQISHEIGGQLVKYSSRDACPLVRCMVVEAFRGLVKQFESQLCAIGIQYIQEIYNKQSQQKSHQNCTKLSLHSITSCPAKRPMRHSTISVVTPPGGTGNGGGGGLLISRQSELTSNHINLHSGWFLTKSSSREVDQQHNYNYYYHSHYKSHLINTQPQASPILRKSVFNPGSVFFTGSGNTPSTNIYVQFWLTLVQLAQDPYPEVSRLATILIQYLYGKIREKAEFQAICYNSPNNNNNDNNDKFITNEDTTLISSLNTSFTSSNTSNDNASSTINELNSIPDNNNSNRFSENASIKELNSNLITSITTNSALQMTTTNSSSSSLIHSAQFPGRRHQQTDQRLRVSITNSPQLPSTIISNNPVTCELPATTTNSSGSNSNYPSSLDTVHTQFFAWSCRWFTRPLLSKYGQLNNGQSKSQTTSKNSFDYEPISLGTISIDPKAVAYTDRVNRLKKQRKISHLGRLQWERVAGQISHPIVTSTSNVNTTTTTISRNISFCNPTPITTTINNNISSIVGMSNMSRSRISLRSNDSGDNNINNSLDDYCLHPIAFYNHHLNHSNNNNCNDNYCSISSQVKFHPYQSHLVMINSERKGVTIHSTKNLKLLHSINTFTTKSSLFPDFPSTIDG
ncbi:unnamed protein product [Schistosoma margrebowiei]|uniref:Uncharacterized protein n=1 Tax=Schistosoma margrebowiei TaxID=48269 RepID=A0A183LTR6_9TREM|nr:unnamed protein product [Schistosoma margrebowiei]